MLDSEEDFKHKIEIEQDKSIFTLIPDKRILRVLFEQKIFSLRQIQKAAIKKGVFFRKSFLISAPSGSGKTLIGELCAINNIFSGFGKSVYLVPFKALATEKFFYFKNYYKRFGIKVELSIGDYDVEDNKLEQADIIITTYEKMDSIFRNFYDKPWIHKISTIIIDEIHTIEDEHRGPRLESLIVRLNESLHNPQIIGLSATIANPELFNSWLSSLGNKTTLIKSDYRPVPLHYHIKIAQDKEYLLKNLVKNTLKNDGQALIFLNTRKSTQLTANLLRKIVKSYLKNEGKKTCKKLETALDNLKGANKELSRIIEFGIAFHHAGLLPKERKIVEENFRKRIIKVICCTTTLSAGVNVPARVVILKDFRRFITSGYNIKNFSGFYESGDGFSFFKPFSGNEVFQMLGRAGRPGMDKIGYGIILTNDMEEKQWVEDHYFQYSSEEKALIPKYNNLTSQLNNLNILKEQVLLRVYEEKKITLEELKSFFQKTYFWFLIKKQKDTKNIPIEQLLMINEISPKNLLKLHSEPNRLEKLRNAFHDIRISDISKNKIAGFVKTHYGVYTCEFDITTGIRCSCGFDNGISDNFSEQKFAFEFCDHISLFLIYLIKHPEKKIRMYTEDIIPSSLKNQYILDYLFEKGLIYRKNGKIQCSQFGKLIIRLYLYPASGVLIREKLEEVEIQSYQDLIKEGYEILKAENRVRGERMLEPILEWIDEEPLEEILERYKIMAGDLYSLRDNLERIITFIGIISQYLISDSREYKNDLIKITEMAETLKLCIHNGVREDLLDLVLRLKNIGRVRARILYNKGYTTATKVKKEKGYVLHKKTGLGLSLCKNITQSKEKYDTSFFKTKSGFKA
ncbi:MAG: hypothetical protein BAJALOKI2v1_540010 [Promethearchaeota archaeon]|nr:MAG: hypothetical protein BAJALOKI2v1_540010 [Candidatus Lokiarchaeota archaeon]